MQTPWQQSSLGSADVRCDSIVQLMLRTHYTLHITHYMTHNMRTCNNMTHNNAVIGELHHQTVKIVGLKIIKRILMVAV